MTGIVLILEAVNLVVAIIVNVQRLELPGLPMDYANYIFIGLFFIGFLALYLNNEKIKREIKGEVIEEVRKDIEALNMRGNEAIKGRLDDVSSGDVDLIVLMNIEMGWKHGHGDLTGLFAGRASGVPLNELMIRNCSQCGIPRNKKSRK